MCDGPDYAISLEALWNQEILCHTATAKNDTKDGYKS
jgi:hypothetical protein